VLESVYPGAQSSTYFNPDPTLYGGVHFASFSIVGGPQVADYGRIAVRYANGSESNLPMDMHLSDGDAILSVSYEFLPTGGWDQWAQEEQETFMPVSAFDGLSLRATSVGGGPNLDSVSMLLC